MITFLKVIGIILIVIVALFILSFLVYMFNLDMKLMAFVRPKLEKVYDKRKRERKI